MQSSRFSFLAWGLLVAIVAGTGMAQAQEARITVTGEGRIAAVPDMARLNLGVEANDAVAAGALAKASEQMNGVMDALNAAGIAPADVQTSTLSVYPQYQNQEERDTPPAITGYIASSDLTVQVHELDGLGDLIDAVSEAGGNRLSGVAFDVQDREPLLNDARRAAVADAMSRAALYADAAKVTLGSVVEITEAGGSFPRPIARMESAGLRSMPVAAGEIDVSASVTMVFTITP